MSLFGDVVWDRLTLPCSCTVQVVNDREVLACARVRMHICEKELGPCPTTSPTTAVRGPRGGSSWYLDPHHATSKGEVGSFEVLAT